MPLQRPLHPLHRSLHIQPLDRIGRHLELSRKALRQVQHQKPHVLFAPAVFRNRVADGGADEKIAVTSFLHFGGSFAPNC